MILGLCKSMLLIVMVKAVLTMLASCRQWCHISANLMIHTLDLHPSVNSLDRSDMIAQSWCFFGP